MRDLEDAVNPGSQRLAEAVARSLFKLMAIKDEYEVGRLMCDPAFLASLKENFDGPVKLKFHLAPPMLAATDEKTGRPKKSIWGGWMMRGFKLLAAAKGIRNTALDPFRYSAERRMNLKLLADYEALVRRMKNGLGQDNIEQWTEILSLPMMVRGYGPVREKAVKEMEALLAAKLAKLGEGTKG